MLTDAIDSVQLPYPLGLADFEELPSTGTPFHTEAWRRVPYLSRVMPS